MCFLNFVRTGFSSPAVSAAYCFCSILEFWKVPACYLVFTLGQLLKCLSVFWFLLIMNCSWPAPRTMLYTITYIFRMSKFSIYFDKCMLCGSIRKLSARFYKFKKALINRNPLKSSKVLVKPILRLFNTKKQFYHTNLFLVILL